MPTMLPLAIRKNVESFRFQSKKKNKKKKKNMEYR